MEYTPFMLLFIFCQLCHPGYVIGKPASDIQAKSLRSNRLETSWPEKCVRHNYCTVKPHDYPSESILKQMYEQEKNNFNFKLRQAGYDRDSDEINKPCGHRNYIVDNVYMIKDESNNIRYAFNIPGLYDFSVLTTKCKINASKYLDQELKDQGYTCIQKDFQYQYIVLSHDMKGLETVNIKLPSGCQVSRI